VSRAVLGIGMRHTGVSVGCAVLPARCTQPLLFAAYSSQVRQREEEERRRLARKGWFGGFVGPRAPGAAPNA
jgi:hypothetical protein